MAALRMSRGDTFRYTTILRKDAVTGLPTTDPNGAPVDLTGALIWFTVKYYAQHPDNMAVFQARSDDVVVSITIVSATGGKIAVTMPALKTITFPDGEVVLLYDIQAKDSAGLLSTWESGTLTVSPDITRAMS